jgi:methylenetetrahydrofolate reductase (NADPH)
MTSTKPELSFEFFPPRTDTGVQSLEKTRNILAGFDPEFFSVTFGAGGSTRDKTLETVLDIRHNSAICAAPHITSVGATNAEIIELLETYRDNGIKHLVALRGDPPGGMVGLGECKHASDLVALIRKTFDRHFTVAVAAYPEAHPDSRNLGDELEHFATKMAAGADLAITQYFYNRDSYYHFLDLCQQKNISQPIIPGIMPINNFDNIVKFSHRCGAEIPRWLQKSMLAYDGDADSQRKLGLEVVTRMTQDLLDNGAPGLHFYTMNQAELCREIIENLSMSA